MAAALLTRVRVLSALLHLQRDMKRFRHRNRVAQEIRDSEAAYVNGLKALCQVRIVAAAAESTTMRARLLTRRPCPTPTVQYKEQLEFNLQVSPEPLASREEITELFKYVLAHCRVVNHVVHSTDRPTGTRRWMDGVQ